MEKQEKIDWSGYVHCVCTGELIQPGDIVFINSWPWGLVRWTQRTDKWSGTPKGFCVDITRQGPSQVKDIWRPTLFDAKNSKVSAQHILWWKANWKRF